MTADEVPSESEPTRDEQQSERGPAERLDPVDQPAPKAEIVLRKHHICPYLGLRDDRTVVAMLPTPAHACFARRKRYSPSVEHQVVRCLSSNYPGCSVYPDKVADTFDSPYTLQGNFGNDEGNWRRWLLWGALAALVLLLIGATAYATMNGMVSLPAQFSLNRLNSPTSTPVVPAANPPVTETFTVTPVPSLPPTTPVPPAQVAASNATNTPRPPTPTPSGPGEVLSLTPSRSDVGWWGSAQAQAGQIGDSFLYAGVLDGQAYISAVRFDLRRVPRGAPIEGGGVRLTGLRDDLLDRNATSSWLIQLISETALSEFPGKSFFTVYEAPASFQLAPNIETADVESGSVNEWVLDGAVRGWLFQQLLDGANSIVVRIIPYASNGNALFAWDSGHGNESRGALPELVLVLGPAPSTPPPTPTRPQIVATLTQTPENVMTVVALTPAATLQAPPTNTPVPPEIVTPTPVAMDLPAVQTAAVAEARPPVLVNTPVPANAATATTNAAYATAVALTTGTFTPVPTDFVTPVLIFPSPPAENIATAAARSVKATAVAQSGAPTPTRPFNAVDAVYVYATATPANQEAAIAQIADQNSLAITTGTPTPTPWNLIVITRVPEPTPTMIPLFIPTSQITPTPTPTATRLLTSQDLDRFRNMILFLSDRDGLEQTWVMEPTTGNVVGVVTDSRIHDEARERFLPFSPNGKERAFVQADGDTATQIKVENYEYNVVQQLTNVVDALVYDPAWSPKGDQIAFVGTMTRGDEIYIIPTSGGDPVQLTFNTWEWDKHPTWSPDGTQIAFFSNRVSGRRQIWIMDSDGSNQHNLSSNEFNDWDPVWVR